MTRNMGGSLLASESAETMRPLPWGEMTLRVVAAPELDTYVLTLAHAAGVSNLAAHPNSYSLHELAKRLTRRDHAAVLAQVEYILACGGMAKRELAFTHWLDAP